MQGAFCPMSALCFLCKLIIAPLIDEHPCVQASPLCCQTTLLRLRSVPRYPRARVHASEHTPPSRQGLYKPVLGRSYRSAAGRSGALFDYRRWTSFTAGASLSAISRMTLQDADLSFIYRQEARFSVLSCRTLTGISLSGPRFRLSPYICDPLL